MLIIHYLVAIVCCFRVAHGKVTMDCSTSSLHRGFIAFSPQSQAFSFSSYRGFKFIGWHHCITKKKTVLSSGSSWTHFCRFLTARWFLQPRFSSHSASSSGVVSWMSAFHPVTWQMDKTSLKQRWMSKRKASTMKWDWLNLVAGRSLQLLLFYQLLPFWS